MSGTRNHAVATGLHTCLSLVAIHHDRVVSMRLFGRPAQPWRDLVELTKHEKALAAAQTPAGWVVATTHALWLPERTGMTRLGWETIDNATWDSDLAALSVRQASLQSARPRRWNVRMDDERDLLLVIKERVRSTLITTRQVRLAGEAEVTVVARRAPGSDELTWSVSLRDGIDVNDPGVRGEINAALARLRAELGQ
jgi:hypothetical protein